MQKTILLALLLVVWNCVGAQSPQESQELKNAALRLKQAAALRTLEDCKAKGGSVKSCNTLLELTHEREVKVIARLKLAPTDPVVNMDEMNKEMTACYSPNYGYVETVECWSQLSDRLDSMLKGRSLLSNAGPAIGSTSVTAQGSIAVTGAEMCKQGYAQACLIADLEKRIDLRMFGESGKYKLVQGPDSLFSTATTPNIMKLAACYYYSEMRISADVEEYTRLTGLRTVDRDRFQICWEQK
jgi:hypothetical protein